MKLSTETATFGGSKKGNEGHPELLNLRAVLTRKGSLSQPKASPKNDSHLRNTAHKRHNISVVGFGPGPKGPGLHKSVCVCVSMCSVLACAAIASQLGKVASQLGKVASQLGKVASQLGKSPLSWESRLSAGKVASQLGQS